MEKRCCCTDGINSTSRSTIQVFTCWSDSFACHPMLVFRSACCSSALFPSALSSCRPLAFSSDNVLPERMLDMLGTLGILDGILSRQLLPPLRLLLFGALLPAASPLLPLLPLLLPVSLRFIPVRVGRRGAAEERQERREGNGAVERKRE